MRGMENLMMDFYLNPEFARELLKKIADYNIEQTRAADQVIIAPVDYPVILTCIRSSIIYTFSPT